MTFATTTSPTHTNFKIRADILDLQASLVQWRRDFHRFPELGFKENFIAKGLKNNRTMAIGIVISNLTDIFSTSIVTVIEREVEKYNYCIILCDYGGKFEKQEEKLRFLKDRSVDGVILYPVGNYLEIINEYIEDNIPIIVLNEDIPGIEIDKVLVDNSNSSFRAVEQLINANHRRIAIINGTKEAYVSKERFKGYIEALQLYDIQIEDKWIKYGNFLCADAYQMTKELMTSDDRPTALYITNYHMTIGAVMALNDLNIKIPDDISVIGYDYFEISNVIKPALTLIEQPYQKIGEVAAELLIRRIKGDYTDYPQKICLNTKMILRDSVKTI